MYRITIQHSQQGAPVLKLTTQTRKLARAAFLLGEENKLKVDVAVEVAARPVKFKGLS